MTEDEHYAKKCLAVTEYIDDYFLGRRPHACVWEDHKEPVCFRCSGIYSLDDYDYVAVLPLQSYHVWVEEGRFSNMVSTFDLPNGWTLVVGYHS